MQVSKKQFAVAALAALGLAAGSASAQGSQQEGSQQGGSAQRQQKQQKQGGSAQQGQQQLSGKVASAQQNTLYLETEQGAVVPFKIGANVQWDGQIQMGEQQQPLKSVKQLQQGDEVQVSFNTSGNQNTAQSVTLNKQAQQPQEISGTVARTSGDTVYLDVQGALVPLKISKQTKFQGQTQSGQPLSSARQIQEGDEVRANFMVHNETTNMAHSIEVSPAGGQGQQGGSQGQQGGSQGQQGGSQGGYGQ